MEDRRGEGEALGAVFIIFIILVLIIAYSVTSGKHWILFTLSGLIPTILFIGGIIGLKNDKNGEDSK